MRAVIDIELVTAGLEPTAGLVNTIDLVPIEVKYTLKVPDPVVIVLELSPCRLDVLSEVAIVELPVYACPSSPERATFIVNEK